MRNIIEFLYLYFCVYLIHVSIDDYLDTLLSGSSEPSSKAIKKLTKLLENFGAIMVASTERMEDYITGLDSRITSIERNLGVSSGSTLTNSAPARAPAMANPTPAAAPSTGAPNLSAAPAMGAPNLSAAPNLSSAPSSGGSAAPAPSGGGGGISNADLMKAASGLTKAPEQQPKEMVDAASFSPSGVSVSAIQDVRAGLKKVDQDEHRKERAAAASGGSSGSMPASMVLNMEVKDALAKRKSRSKKDDDDDEDDDDFAPTQAAPAAPKRSTKQMKEALQGELRDAFSSLLESDTQEEEEK
jgi:hypothetical protein